MLISNKAYRYLKSGIIRYKNISELNNCNYRVKVKCDECGYKYEMIFSNRLNRIKKGRKNDLCQSCSKSGVKNSQYGKDRKKICAIARKYNTKNPMKGKHHSPQAKKIMSESKIDKIANGTFNIKSNNRGKKYWYFSKKNNKKFHADSGLELLRMMQLDEDKNILKWTKRHRIRVEYKYNGSIRNTIPDFFIQTKSGIIIEEVKGRVTEQELIKKKVLEKFCTKNGYLFSFMTQEYMNKNGEYRKFLKKIKND
jgi:hypothetical protein